MNGLLIFSRMSRSAKKAQLVIQCMLFLQLTLRLYKQVALGYLLLLKLLHCVVVLGVVPADEVNFAEGASSDDFEQLEVVQVDLLVRAQEVFAVGPLLPVIIILVVDSFCHDQRVPILQLSVAVLALVWRF